MALRLDPRFVRQARRPRGAPQDKFSLENIAVATGRYRFQVRYLNHGNAINTGITNGVKVLSILDSQGHTGARRVIQMPH